MSRLPEHVTIREVALRDGLQIETPIPLSAKLELLAAIAAAACAKVGGATAFKVAVEGAPPWPTPRIVGTALANYPDISSRHGGQLQRRAPRHRGRLPVGRVRGLGRRRAQPHANVGRSSAEPAHRSPVSPR